MRRGQTIVVVMLSLVALLAVAGLALDGSRIYRTRRILQNAADAAALAGAQELASSSTTQAAVWAKIAQYLQANATTYTNARAWFVQGNVRLQEITANAPTTPPPTGANGVEVIVQRSEPVLFGGVLGQQTALVSARARANVGNLRTLTAGNNIVPIAVHYEVVRYAQPGDILTVWDGFQVSVQPSGGGNASNYGDTNNPYSGWLNLAWIHNADEQNLGNREVDQSHSQANVNNWILNGNPYPIFAGTLSIPPNPPAPDGDFIMGDPGIRASGLQTLEVKRQQLVNQGQRPLFYIVVFDRFFNADQMEQLFPTHGAVPASHGDCGFPNSLYFHAVGFVVIEVTEVRWQGSARGGKYIKGVFVSFVQAGDVNQGSSFPGDTEMVKAVALTE
ncbi:hypothetical protein HRbin17_00297 [bacterium HR17]|uniref:Putative Flp pilus-assembly TadG-like N-terminal domain-containing protein n=1 Tax=Candidatus Fervidibacter japonicus TaxID=2035412 RepID=A0A2H5X9D9_9BACT|nr:hypothetical protein HRbin17_00297 [bacterium HR17]